MYELHPINANSSTAMLSKVTFKNIAFINMMTKQVICKMA